MRPAAATGLGALALLAGCGGGSAGSSTTPPPAPPAATPSTTTTTTSTTTQGADQAASPAAVEAALRDALASSDPAAACDAAVTTAYVKRAYGGHDGCVAALGAGAAATSVTVSDVRIQGASATARAVPTGGASAGARLTAHLVFESGAWRLDSVDSNVPVGP